MTFNVREPIMLEWCLFPFCLCKTRKNWRGRSLPKCCRAAI